MIYYVSRGALNSTQYSLTGAGAVCPHSGPGQFKCVRSLGRWSDKTNV